MNESITGRIIGAQLDQDWMIFPRAGLRPERSNMQITISVSSEDYRKILPNQMVKIENTEWE